MAAISVMLVEDETSQGMIISQILRAAGYSVSWAQDGIQAMQMSKQNPPQLIVSDFMFPAGGGAAFFTRLRMSAQTASVPILILSVHSKESIASVVGAEANAYFLPKPYKKEELLGLLAGMLAGSAPPASRLHDLPESVLTAAPMPARGWVLVIDGDGEERALIHATLAKTDFRVVEARSGDEAMRALGLEGALLNSEAPSPSLIVLDAQIGLGAGHLIAARLARETATHSVPVLVITAGKEMRAAFSDAANVAAYLEKPLDPARLLRHAEELVPVKD